MVCLLKIETLGVRNYSDIVSRNTITHLRRGRFNELELTGYAASKLARSSMVLNHLFCLPVLCIRLVQDYPLTSALEVGRILLQK